MRRLSATQTSVARAGRSPNGPVQRAPNLTQRVEQQARELGFDLVGVAPAAPLEGDAFYARWLALGYAGEMEYLHRYRDRRRDPRRLVPGARSVLCLGLHYGPEAPDLTGPLDGRLARYARGDDYHDIFKKRLAQLWEWMRLQAGRETGPQAGRETGGEPMGRYFVDTAPVLERELAARAGLGWRGKNTCLISQQQGSWFLLGEIVSSLELDPSEPAVDRCGTCTRCLDACPTGALPQAYVLDARRCISYLTIELVGAIPDHLRPGVGNWVLGCDICQEVCPWNRRAPPRREPAFAPRDGLSPPHLPHLLSLNRDAFNALFRRHPGKRPKRRGVLRNAAVALGNSGRAEAVPVLARALGDEEALVRGHAAWGLGQLGGDEAIRALEEAQGREGDAEVRDEIRRALARTRPTEPR